MTRTLDFTRQFALAAGAVAGLTARLDLAGFADEAAQHVYIFVVEALAFGAVGCAASTSGAATAPKAITAFAIVALITRATIAVTVTVTIIVVAHDFS